jgi:hypothetical protein
MQNVPQIVRERLRAAVPAGNHPDADVLTAFAERSLPDLERAGVLEHLARCGNCRDIVALALPATEAVQVVATPRSGRLTWPALRWGFVAAGIVAVASVGIVEFQRQSRQTMMVAKYSHRENIGVSAPAQTSPAAAPVSQPEKGLAKTKDRAMISTSAPLPNPSAMGSGAKLDAAGPDKAKPGEPVQIAQSAPPATVHLPRSSAAIGGPLVRNQSTQWQQTQAARQQNVETSANLKVPPASQAVEVSGVTPQLETTQAGIGQSDLQAQNPPLPSQPSEGLFDNTPGPVKAKPAVTARYRALIPRWAISSTGGLQRSFDQGNTWKDINVTANLGPSPGAENFAALAKESRVEGKKLADKSASMTAPATAPVFRAVAATGIDVWAGGSGGTLFHSVDAGNHWMQVVPSSAGATLTGDVVRLEFSDAQHGKVTTSTPEIWITSDDGQTWQKQ